MPVSFKTSPSLLSQAQFLAPMKSAQYFFVKTRFSMIGIISSAFLVTLTDRMDSVEGSKMLKLRVTSFSKLARNAAS